MIYLSYTNTEYCGECTGHQSQISYCGNDRSAAIKAAQRDYDGSMVQTCTMYLETWKDGKRIQTEIIQHTFGTKTAVV